MSNATRGRTMSKLTPIESKVFDILSDGRPHGIPELMTCLEPYSSVVALQTHIGNIRRKLKPSAYGIKCDESGSRLPGGATTYRLVMNLVSPYDGKQ